MINIKDLKITLLSVLAVTLLGTTSVFATQHYQITTSSSIVDENYSDYSQSGSGETAYGGVFYIGNNGDLTLENVGFYNDYSTRGGAVYIYNSSGSLNLTDIIFDSNSATNGGAIYNQGGTVTISKNGLFNENTSSASGGAIYNTGNTSQLYISSNIAFFGNKASTSGGAVYNYNNGQVYISSNIVFSENTAKNGGAIYNTSGKVYISSNVAFSSNTSSSYGGAIYNNGQAYISSGVAFFSNTSSGYGGAVYNSSQVYISSNISFSENKSSSYGGAIYNTSGQVYISSSVDFSSNTSSNYGGAIYNYNNGQVYISSNVTFSENKSSSYGGAIYNTGSTSKIDISSDVTFSENTAKYGGAIYNTSGQVYISSNIAFSGNTASSYGGAIYNYNNSQVYISSNVVFSGNKAINSGQGGAIYNLGTMRIDNVIFSSNSATYGGAIYNAKTSTITNTTFSDNSASYGGALYGSQITLGEGVVFTGNRTTSSGGGAIYSTGSLYVSSGTIFTENQAVNSNAGNGGAIYSSGKVEMGDGVIFSSNSAKGSNSNTGFGGAIYMSNNSNNVTIGDNAVFDSNYAYSRGGAVYVYSRGTLNIGDNATFSNNSSSAGGVLYSGGETTIGANAIFSSNTGSSTGGAIYVNTGGVTIKENATFESNSTTNSGGAIYNGTSLTIENGAKFISNTASAIYYYSAGGGAIQNSGTLNLIANTYNVEFTGNKAKGISNAINNSGTANLWASDTADIIFNDRITGTGSGTININSSTDTLTANGRIILNEDMSGFTGTTNIYGGEVEFKSKKGNNSKINTYKFVKGTVNLSSGTLNIMNNAIDNIALTTFTVTQANLKFDADLSNNTSDNFTITNTITEGELNLTGINLLGCKNDVETGTITLFKNSNSPTLNVLTTASCGGNIYTFTTGATSGTLNYIISGYKPFKEYVNDTETEIRSYSFGTSGENVSEGLGDLGGTQFTIFGNGYNLVANSVTGINVSSEQTLNIDGINEISGFTNENNGGFLYNNEGNINAGNGTSFSSNSADNGGAVYNSLGILTISDNASFINNVATSQGGAIYNNEGTINLITNTGNVVFTGNTANGISNAIHDNNGTMNLWASENASIIFNDRLTSEDSSSVMNINITTSTMLTKGQVILNEDMSGYTGTVNVYGGELLLQAKTEDGSNINTNKLFSRTMNINDGTLNVLNNAIDNIVVSTLNVTGNVNLKFDADLSTNASDNFTVTNVTGAFNLTAINLLGVNEDIGQITVFNSENAPELNILTTGGYKGYEYTFTNSDVAGVLNYEKTGLIAKTFKEYVNALEPEIRSYSLSEDEIVTESLNSLGGEELTIFGNGYDITSSYYWGISVDEDKTLNVENVNNYSGFSYGAISNYGTLNISGTNFSNNSQQDIYNEGNLFLSGTASTFETGIYGYYGSATTTIDGVDIDLGDTAFIRQQSIIINDDASLTANASNVSGNISNSGTLIFNDGTNESQISGTGQLYMNGELVNTGAIEQDIVAINGSLENKSTIAATDMYIDGTFKIGKNGSFYSATNSTITDGSFIDLQNNKIQSHNFGKLTISSGKIDLSVEADLEKARMDRISADSDSEINGTINIKSINVLRDSKDITEILLTNSEVLKDKITTSGTASSKLYKYEVSYDNGYLRFINGNNPLVNPAVVEQAVASYVGGFAAQNVILGQVFTSLDTEISDRLEANRDIKPSNMYAATEAQIFGTDNIIERGLWLRPFVLQDSVKIGVYDVDNSLYGTLAGVDLPVREDTTVSVYLGYAGSTQKYDEVKMSQTGYVVGATGMFVKDEWYLGLTANMIFNKASADTDNGTDEFDMNMFSIGAKAGYIIGMGDSWILEPNLMLMYGTANAQEYETSMGAKIDSQSVSNIVVEPQVKAKLQLENGWQPYGLVGYVANMNDKAKVVADAMEFELDKVDGYVEYGIGVNKEFEFTPWSCYGQITGMSGGRSGFAGNFGVKYRF
ncbi:MAG: hypothetical protein J6T23_01575 [Elusimicrobia bacterium]|nr:hypothetical protein [Elusimicrobiota bacterium]